MLHATWLAQVAGWCGRSAVMYARSTDGGQPERACVAQGAVITGGCRRPEQVHLVWNRLWAGVVTACWPRRGSTFSRWRTALVGTNTRPGAGEVSGPVGLTADGIGGLHLVGVVGPKQSVCCIVDGMDRLDRRSEIQLESERRGR
jgi:hypothetical protein